MNYILNNTIKDCRNKNFQSFEYRCVYDISYANTENNEVTFTNIIGFMKFKSQFYGLSTKIKSARNNRFRFSDKVKKNKNFLKSIKYKSML